MEENKNFNIEEPENTPEAVKEDDFIIGAGFQIADETEESVGKTKKKKRMESHTLFLLSL